MSDEPTAQSSTPAETLFVAGWHVDASTHRISKAGKTIKLEPRTMAVLVYLAGHPGAAVTREELEREVWRDMVVGYDALSNTIAKLRKAFGDDRKHPKVIETISKVGYRLIAEVGLATPSRAEEIPVGLRAGAALASPAPAAAGREPPRRPLAAIAALIALLVAAGAGLAWFKPWEPAGLKALAPPDTPSIVVLPFANLSDDPEEEYFADGMTDDLITGLSKIQGLFVISRHSAFTYKDKPVKPRQVAEELGVRYLVEGSIWRAGGRVRVNAQLIDAITGGHLWAERYDGDETDLFTLQDRVIANIVSVLSVRLTDREKSRVSRRPTDNLEAYDYYLRAERSQMYGFGGVRHHQTIWLYREAIALDPNFAEAYAGLAEIAFWVLRWDNTAVLPNPIARKLAYESASTVLSMDPENPRAYMVLAKLQVTDGLHDLALESASTAVSLDPNNAAAYASLAIVLVWAGQQAEALAAMETALRLDPKPPAYFYGDLGMVLFFNRRYEEAIEQLEKTREAGVDYREELAMTYAQLGRLDEAKRMVENLFNMFPFANLAYFRVLYAQHKREEDLEHRIEALRKAGFPDWPYGFQPRLEDRLDRDSLEALTFGRTWEGHDAADARFVQQFNEDGRVAFRSRASLLVGTARLKDDMLCVKFPAALLNREDCGYVYRTPEDTPEGATAFVRVALGDIYYFSVTP